MKLRTLCIVSCLSLAGRMLGRAENINNAVIPLYSGGRFGDNLLAIAHTLYFSKKYNIPMFFAPFPYSDKLVLSDVIPQCPDNFEKRFKKKITFQDGKTPVYGAQKTLFVIPYFPESASEYVAESWMNFDIDWEDPEFKRELKKILAYKGSLTLITPPQDIFSVAVHLRRGGGYDKPDYQSVLVYKIPRDEYYINQIKAISKLVGDKPIYVFLFTDDADPISVLNFYKSKVNIPSITFECRDVNNHRSNVLEDFFSMTQFDALIRSESNFSIMAEKISDHSVVISPGSFEKGTRIHTGIVRINHKIW